MISRTVICFLICVLSACSREPVEIPSVGTLERDRIELIADSNEPILQILVREGDRVGVGDVILIQDTSRQEVKLAQAMNERDVALAKLREAESGPRTQQIKQGQARLQAARSAVKTIRYELDREKALVDKNYASKNLVDILQGRYEGALARELEALAALDELEEGTRTEIIDQAKSAHDVAKAVISNLQITLQRSTIRASSSGIIEALPYEAGERPGLDKTVVAILADGITYARVHIPQPLRTRLTSNTDAKITIDGYANSFQGRVRWISSDASFTPYYALTQHDRSQLSYLAEIDLVGAEAAKLPIGIPVEVTFPGLQ